MDIKLMKRKLLRELETIKVVITSALRTTEVRTMAYYVSIGDGPPTVC